MSTDPMSTVQFAAAARELSRASRALGLVAPSFRCPPRLVGAQRSLRRYRGGVAVAVQLRDRPWSAVVGDMIEGVVVANALRPPHSDRVRTDLWQAIQPDVASGATAAGQAA
jgi:hypothetical protein